MTICNIVFSVANIVSIILMSVSVASQGVMLPLYVASDRKYFN